MSTVVLRVFGLASLGMASLLPGQDLFPRNYLNFGAGVGMPRGEINEFFDNRFGMTFNYGYRIHRYFQIDGDYDVVFGAAKIRDTLQTQLGPARIRDQQHFILFGGRGIAPLARGRVLISGGGGGAYMRYQESVRQPSNFYRIACPPCIGRGGWGGYALVNAKFTSRWQRIWFGVTSKVIRGSSEGDPFGGLPVTRTKDHWINTFFEVGFGF